MAQVHNVSESGSERKQGGTSLRHTRQRDLQGDPYPLCIPQNEIVNDRQSPGKIRSMFVSYFFSTIWL